MKRGNSTESSDDDIPLSKYKRSELTEYDSDADPDYTATKEYKEHLHRKKKRYANYYVPFTSSAVILTVMGDCIPDRFKILLKK